MSASRERYPFDDYLTGNLARDTAFRALIECPTYGTVDAVLDAYRDEVLREAAEAIRKHTAADYDHVLAAYGSAYANGWKFGRDRAADLVEGGA